MDIECWQKFVRTCENIPKEEQGAQKFKKLTFKFHPSKVSDCKYHIMDIECWQKYEMTCGNIPKDEQGAQKFKKLTFKFHPSKVNHQSRCAPSLLPS
jgi:transcription initiation factor IIF auxiliary subunit